MLIRHIGHAEFLIETESATRIITDPYDDSCGYPVRHETADIVLVSHGHHDHNAVENVSGDPVIISRAGTYTPAQGIRITAIKSYHDPVHGAQRGENLIFLIEAEGLRMIHAGDLGCMPDEEQIRIMKNTDILMIPVGGFFTIDGNQARITAQALEARIILPMHYKTKYNESWPISGPEEFLRGFGENEILKDAEALRVTEGDKTCHPKVVLFKEP